MRFWPYVILACASGAIAAESKGERAATPPHVASPSSPPMRVDLTRDTWVADVEGQSDGSNGGSSQMKLKSIQELSLIDIDPAPLKGRVITGATLHVHLAGPEPLRRVTVGTFAADWVEGSGNAYAVDAGVSSFEHRRNPDVPWAYPGSDMTAVMLGEGGTVWYHADATPPDEGRWQTIAVDPSVVAARVAGVSTGLVLFDDTGTEWTHAGESFKLRIFPNRTFHSKDSNRSVAPYLTVQLGAADAQPPAPPTGLMSRVDDLPAGEAYVSWISPTDVGPAGTIGFHVEVDGKPVPRYLIPRAARAGQHVTMLLRELGLKPAQAVKVAIRAVDGAGNIGAPATLSVKTSGEVAAPLPGKNGEPFKSKNPLPKLGDAEIAIIDALDKVQPVTGQMIPPQAPGYLASNHLWDGKQIRLHAAMGEIVSFQILVRGRVQDLTADLNFAPSRSGKTVRLPPARFFRFRYVNSKAGPVPDPLVPLPAGGRVLSVPSTEDSLPGQTSGSLLCEVMVPYDLIGSGDRTGAGTLTLTAAGRSTSIPVTLKIWDFMLPQRLSFLPEMNCYGLPQDEADYYRLAHANRTVLNRVSAHHDGSIEPGCAPIWDAKTRKLDWTAWDKRFGPYFDATAFADDAGRGRFPLEVFYLPLFENWPTPMSSNYNESYWANGAFTESYKRDFIEVSRQFAQHFKEKSWDDTLFLCFFNGKNNFKARGWSHSTCPWLLDEPANFQDFAALRFFGELFHTGVNLAPPGDAKMLFRADISRPEWQRDELDHVLDYNVVAGGAFRQYNRMVIDRKRRLGQIVIPYGGTNDPADSNVQPLAWCLDSWTLGGDGVLPWQTVGHEKSWQKADALCLFYPGGHAGAGQRGPVPSIRLKAYLRGEQDVEYLTLLADVQKQSRYLLAPRIRAALPLTGQRHGTGFTAGEDAGIIDFAHLKPQDVWALRVRIGELLDAAHPLPRAELIDFRTPKRDPSAGPRASVSTSVNSLPASVR